MAQRVGALVRRLFVTRLPPTTSSKTLKDYFAKFGEVERADIAIDGHTGRSRGFGFVTFKEGIAASSILSEIHKLEGGIIHVAEAKHSPPRFRNLSGQDNPLPNLNMNDSS